MSAVKLGSNIASLSAQRRLTEGTTQLSKTFERLSSGMRINRASDDAAGLSISDSLRADRRVFNQGVRNLNDGVSLLNIADGAIEQLSSIVIRLKELAEQSANGTYGVKQRKAIDTEAQTLSKEYLRIIQTTSFNGKNLFGAEFGELRLQAGYGLDGGLQSGLGGAIGTGSYTTAASHANFSANFNSIALGDVNGDGILDMIESYYYGDAQIHIKLGKGDGTFEATTTFSVAGNGLFDVQFADLNGDGFLDIVALKFGGEVNVKLGNGDGTFADSITANVGAGKTKITLGDINGDGNLDIVAGGTNTAVILGTGDGTFGSVTSYAGNAYELYDLNGNGNLDMISIAAGGAITVRAGGGDGTFAEAVTYAMGANLISIGDINGDGIPDIVGMGLDGTVTTRLGSGNGTFGAISTQSFTSTDRYAFTLADMNGDGILDLVSGGGDFMQSITAVQFGRGDGTFMEAQTFATVSGAAWSLALGDLNGDGVLDIVVSDYHGDLSGGTTSIMLGNTKPGISALLDFSLNTRAGSLQALSQFDKALERISTQRGQIGSFQSRIHVAVNTLQATSENYASAEGRIRNADIAEESSKLVRLNILQQAAASVLAQANLQPSIALSLLSNNGKR